MDKTQHGLAQLAKLWVGQTRGASSLFIEQNGAPNGFEIASHALAVVIKGSSHTAHVSRARVAGDQTLNHLPAKKRAHVRVIKESVQCSGQCRTTRRVGRDSHAEKAGFQIGMPACREVHRLCRVGKVVNGFTRDGCGVGHTASFIDLVASEDPRQVTHVGATVGFCQHPILGGAVVVELVEANAEQLHDFTRIVLVRNTACCGVFLLIAGRVEVKAHGRMKRHRLQQ